MNSFFISRWLPPNTEGSAEPCEAIGACLRTQVRTFKACNLCQILHYESHPVFPLSSFRFFNRSRMTGRYLIPFCKNISFVSAPTCPFRQPDGCHLPRQAGTALGSYSFLFKQKVIYCLSKTHFTPAVILERRAILE